MKYWMFQSNQVTGPYEIEDLPTVAGYCAETLVCPEGRKGTSMGDWQRASMVPELSVSLLKVIQLATVLKGTGAIMGGLPPEPTLKDLAALGSLQERMELLDNTVAQLQENLKLKDQELLSVHRDLDEKDRLAKQLAVQVGGLEQRLGSVNDLNSNLKEGLDKAVAAEHEVESSVQSQARTIEELTRQLSDLQNEKARLEGAMAGKQDLEELRSHLQELEELKAQMRELKERPTASGSSQPFAPSGSPLAQTGPSVPSLDAPAASPFAPSGPTKPLGELKPEPFSLKTPAAEPAPAPAPALGPGGFTPIGQSAAQASDFLGLPPAGASLPPAPSPIPDTVPPAVSSAPAPFDAPAPTSAPTTGSVIPATPAVISSAATPAPAAGTKKPNIFLFIVLGIGAVGGFAAVKLGLLGGKRSAPPALTDRAPVLPPTPPVEPAPPPKPPTPSPEEILEGKKKDAINLVDGWSLASGKTVGMAAAEGTTPSDGAALPWMAEPMPGRDGVFQVNFFAEKPGLPAVTYEFEADLTAKKVAAHNEAAKALLEGKATAPKKKRRKAVKSKAAKPKAAAQGDDKPILEDLLVVNPDDDQAVKAKENAELPTDETQTKKPARKSRMKPRNTIQDLDSFLDGASEPAPKTKVRPKDQPKEESLDDLLVPGNGGNKGSVEEPQAQPEPAPAPKDDAAAESAADENAGAPPQHPEEAQPKKKSADEALDDLLK